MYNKSQKGGISWQPKQERFFERKEGTKVLNARSSDIRTEDCPFKLTARCSLVTLTRDISGVRAGARL